MLGICMFLLLLLSLYNVSDDTLICSESAATLEAESGYSMESPEVSDFRQCILDGAWAQAEAALERLGVAEDEGLRVRMSI